MYLHCDRCKLLLEKPRNVRGSHGVICQKCQNKRSNDRNKVWRNKNCTKRLKGKPTKEEIIKVTKYSLKRYAKTYKDLANN